MVNTLTYRLLVARRTLNAPEIRFVRGACRPSLDGDEMDGLSSVIGGLQDLVSEQEREAAEEERQAAEKRQRSTKVLQVLRWATAELQALAEADVLPEAGALGSGFGSSVAERSVGERPLGMGHEGPPWIFHPVFSKFLPPEKDEEMKEPVYDPRVVSGKRNYRQRALAAARVYGPELREPALADAIFRTGETNAGDASSARASLGGLTRYGQEWTRKHGWLIYAGEGLAPDQAMILLLSRERDETREQAGVEGENAESSAIVTQTSGESYVS